MALTPPFLLGDTAGTTPVTPRVGHSVLVGFVRVLDRTDRGQIGSGSMWVRGVL